MGKYLPIVLLGLMPLSGCVSNELMRDPNSLPKGASFLECTDITGQWNGMYTSAQGNGLRCFKFGDGFERVRSVETKNGKVEFSE